MSEKKQNEGCLAMLLIGFVVLVLAVSLGLLWYKAGIQVDVYQREGIHMTQWEVFMGSKPAERTINIK